MRGKVGTWVNSQWKYQATPGQFSVAINTQDTASRDIADLLAKGILQKGEAGGRSTAYKLVLNFPMNHVPSSG